MNNVSPVHHYRVAFTAEFAYEDIRAFDAEHAKTIAAQMWMHAVRPTGTGLPSEMTVTEVAEKRSWGRKQKPVTEPSK